MMTHGKIKALWPHLRVVLIGGHVLAVALLSFPQPRVLTNPRGWASDNIQTELTRWAARLQDLGVDTSKELLERDLRALVQQYTRVHRAVISPFARYAQLSGARQGWQMFTNPQKHPAELHIEVREHGRWRPIYRPHSAEYDFWAAQLRHNRLRKVLGRFARTFYPGTYNDVARFLARQAARAFPAATEVRVRLYRYTILPPAAVRAGRAPAGRYEHERVFATEALP